MQEAGLATPQGLLRIQAPAKETPLLLRLRCYLPSTSATLLILAAAFIAFHSAASHTFAALGLATEIVIGLGLAGLTAGTIVVSAVTIQRRRAAAGACHTCSHPCRGAMVPLPERDAQLWPHRPLSYLPGGRPPVPPDVRAGGPDRKNRDLISPASTDEKAWPQRALPVGDEKLLVPVRARLPLVALGEPVQISGGMSPSRPCAAGTPEPQRLRDHSYPARQTTFAGPA